MAKGTCSVDGCERDTVGRGVCGKHYYRLRRYGDPLGGGQERYVATQNTCLVDECQSEPKSLGYCIKHYTRLRNHGDADTVKKIAAYPAGAGCSVDGCRKHPIARGWCPEHYQRWKNHGDPLGGNPSPAVHQAVDLPDGRRVCSGCGEAKPIEQFDKDKRASGGRRSKCKACRGAHMYTYYRENREQRLAYARQRLEDNPGPIREADRERYYRDRDKRIELVLKAQHVRRERIKNSSPDRGITKTKLRAIHGDRCCYCDVMMEFGPTKGHGFVPDRATIEHIVPLSRGGAHTWDNTCLACWQCNVRKNRRLVDEWRGEGQDRAADLHTPAA